jgi:hypothetical protein
VFEIVFHSSHKPRCVSIIITDWLILFKDLISFYSDNNTKTMNTWRKSSYSYLALYKMCFIISKVGMREKSATMTYFHFTGHNKCNSILSGRHGTQYFLVSSHYFLLPDSIFQCVVKVQNFVSLKLTFNRTVRNYEDFRFHM